MSTLNQFLGIGTSITVSNLSSCITLTIDDTASLGSVPKGSGGILICKSSSVAWIVAPRCAEVSRAWANRDDANTLANACTGFSGWFVPTLSQLQNPGYACRVNWEYPTAFAAYNIASYWTSTERNATNAYDVSMSTGGSNTSVHTKTNINCVRSFRCVTY